MPGYLDGAGSLMTSCLLCDQPMDEFLVEHNYAFHPTCDDQDSSEAIDLKRDVQHLIRWADGHSPRSLQTAIGPSEMGDACDRRIAYRLAGTPSVNSARDPWPAIVGTAIHVWLEGAVERYQREEKDLFWDTEVTVQPDRFVVGHSDVYDALKRRVIDWKTAGTDVMRKIRKQGPPRSYIVQANLYGLGHERAGRPVNDVALVFLPRAGWLSGIYVWRDRYRRGLAQQAVTRLYSIGDQLLRGARPHQLSASPADACGFCPWFQSTDTLMGIEASEHGCPGR